MPTNVFICVKLKYQLSWYSISRQNDLNFYSFRFVQDFADVHNSLIINRLVAVDANVIVNVCYIVVVGHMLRQNQKKRRNFKKFRLSFIINQVLSILF